MLLLSVALVSVWSVASVIAYSSVAPRVACGSLHPGHGRAASTASRYALRVEGALGSYTASQVISVCIEGDTTFVGFMLQARLADGSSPVPVGHFAEPASVGRSVDCRTVRDTLTHRDDTHKQDVCFAWTAPDSDHGEVSFWATINLSKNTYWMNHKSSALRFSSGSNVGTPTSSTAANNAASTTTTTTTTTATTTTTSQSGDDWSDTSSREEEGSDEEDRDGEDGDEERRDGEDREEGRQGAEGERGGDPTGTTTTTDAPSREEGEEEGRGPSSTTTTDDRAPNDVEQKTSTVATTLKVDAAAGYRSGASALTSGPLLLLAATIATVAGRQ